MMIDKCGRTNVNINPKFKTVTQSKLNSYCSIDNIGNIFNYIKTSQKQLFAVNF